MKTEVARAINSAMFFCLALQFGCGESGGEGVGTDTWRVLEVLTDDGTVVIEKIAYESEGLNVFGQLCRPASDGPFDAWFVNHGGFVGLAEEWNGGLCKAGAMQGFVVFQSSYRGEDGSEGDVEVCQGEVTDVLELVRLARARETLVNPDNIIMWGASHGGCITLRAVQRGVPVVAAAAAVPPTDWSSLHQFWTDALATGPSQPLRGVWEELITVTEDALGGTPAEVPEAYAERSPLLFVDDLLAAKTDVMIIHGGVDQLVPATQGCSLASAAKVGAYHVVDAQGGVSIEAAPTCEGSDVTWMTGPRPTPTWPSPLHFQFYTDMGHGFEGDTGLVGLDDTFDFLNARR